MPTSSQVALSKTFPNVTSFLIYTSLDEISKSFLALTPNYGMFLQVREVKVSAHWNEEQVSEIEWRWLCNFTDPLSTTELHA